MQSSAFQKQGPYQDAWVERILVASHQRKIHSTFHKIDIKAISLNCKAFYVVADSSVKPYFLTFFLSGYSFLSACLTDFTLYTQHARTFCFSSVRIIPVMFIIYSFTASLFFLYEELWHVQFTLLKLVAHTVLSSF